MNMDIETQIKIIVHYKNKQYTFIECKYALYYFYTTDNDNNNISVAKYYLLTSVKENNKYQTSEKIEGGVNSRSLQQEIGQPRTPAFINIITNNLIQNCEVTIDDVNRPHIIYGTETPSLHVKMIRTQHLKLNIENIPLLLLISNNTKHLNFYTNFYVNVYALLHTKSGRVNFLPV